MTSSADLTTEPLVRALGVSKSFGGVRALAGVDLALAAGEVHALCGENGAGKSTLIKILAGYYAPDQGRVEIQGQPLPPSVAAAREMGVSVIHQELVACLDLDAVDNVFVGRERRLPGGILLDRAAMHAATRTLLGRLGEGFDVGRPLAELTVAQRQMTGIARALSQECRLLILDEPTASLSMRETQALFRMVRQMRSEGAAILYVSHRMEEIFALADRVTVLRDGQHVATRQIGDVTPQALIELMVGRAVDPLDDAGRGGAAGAHGVPLLEVRNLTCDGVFADVSFSVRAGEVVGLAGLVGAGRSEVAQAIFGAAAYDAGSVAVAGQPLPRGSIAASIQAGIALTPEDRQHDGLVLPMSAAANLTMAVLRSLTRGGLIDRRRERDLAQCAADDMQVRAARLSLSAEALSGGNQQKLVLGKWLATKPRVLILDEPTRGVDVAAKAEIHRRVRALTDAGMATLVISSELPEVLRICDRVLVMREGRLSGELSRDEATEQKILELALPVATSAVADAARAPVDAKGRRRPAARTFLRRREAWLAALLAAIFVGVGTVKPSFLSLANLADVAADAAPAAIVACAMTLVVATGEIDISVGSLAGLTAAVLGVSSYGPAAPMSPAAGAACALATALGVGVLNGILITWGRTPSIIATLGMLTMLRGVTKLGMGGESIEGRPDALRDLATGAVGGVPASVLVAGAVALATGILARRTPWGRRIDAVGSNPHAASLMGVSVERTKLAVFALSGLMTGVATLLMAPKNSIIQPNLGEGLELLVITCVVVGGTSIRGGRASVSGTLLAVVLLSLVPTALTYVGAPPQWRLAIQGAFILAAVLADHLTPRAAGHGGAA